MKASSDSERVTRTIEIARRVMASLPAFQVMWCEGWRPESGVMEHYEDLAKEVKFPRPE